MEHLKEGNALRPDYHNAHARPDTVGHGIQNSTSFRWHEWELAPVYIDGATSAIVFE
jgi:hypothetical protein